MNQELLISIIIPCFNAKNTIGRCLTSLKKQTYHNFELILIDDGSTDDTKKIIEKCADIPNINLLINPGNKGPLYSRLRGLGISTGEYIVFIDADDYVNEYYIENLVKIAITEKADIIFSDIESDVNELRPINLDIECPNIFVKFFETGGKNIHWYVFWGKMYNSKLLKQTILQFKEKNMYMTEDLYCNIEILSKCKKIRYSSRSKYTYTQSDSTLTTDNKMMTRIITDCDDISKSLCALLIKCNIMHLKKKYYMRWSFHFYKIYGRITFKNVSTVMRYKTILKITKSLIINPLINRG